MPSVTIDQLAELLGGTVLTPGPALIASIAEPEQAGPTQAAFILGEGRTLARDLGVVITASTDLLGPAQITVPQPRVAFAKALDFFFGPPVQLPSPGVHPSAFIDPQAQVDPTARIAMGVYVGPQAVVGADTALFPGVYIGAAAQIGSGCILYPNAVVLDRSVLGNRVILNPGAVIGGDGFGYAPTRQGHLKIPQIGRVVLEDDVEIGANSTIDRATLTETRVQRGTKIDNLVMIGHNVQVGADCLLISQSGLAGSTKIGDRTIIAAQAGVAATTHLEVGPDSLIYGRSGVHKSFPAGSKIAGFPAQDHGRERRQQIALMRLPELLKEFRSLQRRVEALAAVAQLDPLSDPLEQPETVLD